MRYNKRALGTVADALWGAAYPSMVKIVAIRISRRTARRDGVLPSLAPNRGGPCRQS